MAYLLIVASRNLVSSLEDYLPRFPSSFDFLMIPKMWLAATIFFSKKLSLSLASKGLSKIEDLFKARWELGTKTTIAEPLKDKISQPQRIEIEDLVIDQVESTLTDPAQTREALTILARWILRSKKIECRRISKAINDL